MSAAGQSDAAPMPPTSQGPPYPPAGASLGGQPSVGVDVPVSAVFALLFALSAAVNMTVFQRNRRRHHKFVFSSVLFGFSMARLTANIMRIVWAFYPRNASVAIAASILANAGVVVVLLPRRRLSVDKFGSSSMRTKLLLLLFTSLLLTLGAGFRAGVAFIQRPADAPAWFHHKACFYCFNYVIELVVVFNYVVSRFDRRFHVPDGSSQPGDYSGGKSAAVDDAAFATDQHRQREQQMAWDDSLRRDIAQQREALAGQ